MKHIKLFEEFVTEKKKVYDYGCAMLYFEFPEMENLHKQIDEEDIFVDPEDSTFGLETEPHCTLLYGLHSDVKLEVIENIAKNFAFGNCTITNPSLFKNEKFDVLHSHYWLSGKVAMPAAKWPGAGAFADTKSPVYQSIAAVVASPDTAYSWQTLRQTTYLLCLVRGEPNG